MSQVVQVGGSLCILGGFALAQWGVLDQRSRRYLLLNAVGGAVLAVEAFTGRQWGFLLLEGVWAIVSILSLIRVLRPAAPGAPHSTGALAHQTPTQHMPIYQPPPTRRGRSRMRAH